MAVLPLIDQLIATAVLLADIGIIGLNDMEIARWESFDLTTIRQPVREIIESSIELVVAMLDEADRYPEARVFHCELVERGTLKPLPKPALERPRRLRPNLPRKLMWR